MIIKPNITKESGCKTYFNFWVC